MPGYHRRREFQIHSAWVGVAAGLLFVPRPLPYLLCYTTVYSSLLRCCTNFRGSLYDDHRLLSFFLSRVDHWELITCGAFHCSTRHLTIPYLTLPCFIHLALRISYISYFCCRGSSTPTTRCGTKLHCRSFDHSDCLRLLSTGLRIFQVQANTLLSILFRCTWHIQQLLWYTHVRHSNIKITSMVDDESKSLTPHAPVGWRGPYYIYT